MQAQVFQLISSQLQRSDSQARATQTRSCIWSQANISSLITSNHGVAYTHEQKSRAWSRASMELHLITSKHLQLGQAQAWSFIWSRANISILITRKHRVALDHMHKSLAWSRASMDFCDSGISGDSNADPCWLASSQPAPTLSRFLIPYLMYTRVVGNVYYNTCTRSMKCRPGDRQRTVVWLILSVI